MAIAYVGAGTGQSGDTASPSVVVPDGVQALDIVLVIMWTPVAATITPPAGFAEVSGLPVTVDSDVTHLFWKRLTGADSGTYPFATSTNTWHARRAFAFRGVVDTGDPWEADVGVATTDPGNSALVDMDTTEANTMGILIMGAYSGDESGFWTTPSGWTAPAGAQPLINFNLAYKTLTSTGNTGSISFTAPNPDHAVTSWVGALKQAGSLSRTATVSLSAALTAPAVVAKSASATMSLSADITVVSAAERLASASASLSVALTAEGVVGKSATVSMPLSANAAATGDIGSAFFQAPSLSLEARIATAHRMDAALSASQALIVAIQASGTTGRAATASMPLSATVTSAGLKAPTGVADRSLAVTITAVGQSTKAASSTLAASVAITAAGYRGSGATTATRWLRINGSWVKVPA